MSETLMGSLSGYGAVGLAAAFAGAAAGLIRAYIVHRTRMQGEREASARTASRMTGLMGLAGARHDAVRIVECDRDGQRVVEFGARPTQQGTDDRKAA